LAQLVLLSEILFQIQKFRIDKIDNVKLLYKFAKQEYKQVEEIDFQFIIIDWPLRN
jgi:hypothetical protein